VVRVAPLLALVALLAAYYAGSESLPDLGLWGDVAFVGFALLPATFLAVWLALPLRWELEAKRLAWVVVGLAAFTVALDFGGFEVAANFTKFATVVCAGWWFLQFFEAVSWVLLVALLIVPVDIFSVARGPTKVIVEQQPQIFDALSIGFPIPGERNSAQLGLPDVLFFALFLAAAERFGLRVFRTWVAMALSFGTTLALAVWWDVSGLPALPLLSLGFVLVNVDLLWREWRSRGLGLRGARESDPPAPPTSGA
jgi:hypothetical protein